MKTRIYAAPSVKGLMLKRASTARMTTRTGHWSLFCILFKYFCLFFSDNGAALRKRRSCDHIFVDVALCSHSG